MSCTDNPVLDALGDTLLKDGNEVKTNDVLTGKSVIGLYFSAHWCPPCRGFTPDLCKRYTALKEAGKEFELIFISGDRDQKSFDEYHKSMNFLALPFDNQDGNETLNEMFEVSGIPALVFVDAATGQKITDEGREAISLPNYISKFPYKPKPFNFFESLGDTLVGKSGNVATKDALAGKSVLGLYFSAHWCPPCRGFTPKLSERYTKLKDAGKDFELVFVSSDRDQSAFDEYHKEMTFMAMPYSNRDGKNELSKAFGVSGIPSLVFVDAATGKLITDEGRGAISADTFIEDFPYHPKPVNDLGTTTSGINDKSSLIIFMEDSSAEEQKALTSMLTEIAEAEQKLPEKEQAVQRFFTATKGGPLSQIRQGCKLAMVVKPHEHELNECQVKSADKAEARAPCMMILNLRAKGSYFKSDAPVNADSVKQFMKDFAAKKLTGGTFGE
jgi:nucleoredoxin